MCVCFSRREVKLKRGLEEKMEAYKSKRGSISLRNKSDKAPCGGKRQSEEHWENLSGDVKRHKYSKLMKNPPAGIPHICGRIISQATEGH